jgi:hypothetical protein
VRGCMLLLVVAVSLSLSGAPRTALAVGERTPATVRRELTEIFEDPGYTYCHDEDVALFSLDREYCELVEPKDSVCPALPKVCKNEVEPKVAENAPQGRLRFGRDGKDYGPKKKDGEKDYADYSKDQGYGKGGSKDGSGDKPGAGGKDGQDKKSGDNPKDAPTEKDKGKDKSDPKPKEPPPEPETLSLPAWVAWMFRVLFYVIVAAVLGLIGYFIYKNLIKGRGDADEETSDDKPEMPPEAAAIPRGPIETDVDRLLAKARSLAQAGKYDEAIDSAYAALLRRLEGDGLLDLHPSRTNGDYVRALRDRQELKQALRHIATDVERVQFGDSEASPTLFESIYARVLPLVGRTAAVVALLLGATHVSSCEAPRQPPVLAVAGRPHVGGSSPAGLSALVRLLETNDKNVTVRRPRDDEPLPAETAIVILPGTPIDEVRWNDLWRWAQEDGGTLIFAGYREVLDREGVNFDFTTENSPLSVPLESTYYAGRNLELRLPHLASLTLSTPKTAKGGAPRANVQPILTRADRKIYAVSIERGYGNGTVYAFADDRLFANLALPLGDNAAFLVEFFSILPKDVEFWDEPQGKLAGGGSSGGTLRPGEEPSGAGSGGGANNPLDSVANAKLLPIILQLLALVVLYLLYRGTRFGTPREPKETSRRAYADHSRALGMTYARAGANRHATSVFSVWALDRLRERFLKGGRKGLTPLAEAIAASTGRPLAEVMSVLVEASGARDEVAPPSSYRGHDAHAYHAAPADPRRPFWVMEQLDRYLEIKANPKRGKSSR